MDASCNLNYGARADGLTQHDECAIEKWEVSRYEVNYGYEVDLPLPYRFDFFGEGKGVIVYL